MSNSDVVRVRVPIATKEMHRAAYRYAATDSAEAQAGALGRRLDGQPWIEGDLAGAEVDLVWWLGRG